jgi:flagellar hook assembly protein FlgD
MFENTLGRKPREAEFASEIGRPPRRLDPLRGLAGVTAVFLLSFAVAAATPTISGLTVRPAYFAPNGDGRADSTEVSFVPGGAGASVDVRVEVRRVTGDALVGTPLPPTSLPAAVQVRVGWNPGPIADGAYRFDVLVVDGPDSLVSSAVVVADTAAPAVTFFGAVGPNPFDPASSPPNNVLRVPVRTLADSTSATATVVDILDSTGAETDTLGSFVGSDSVEVTWNGKTSGGAAAPSGHYTARAVAADLAGNADTALVAITVDREAPTLGGTADTLQTTTFPFVVTGNAADADRVVAVTRSFDHGATYGLVDTMSPPGPAVTWSTAVTYPSPAPGFFSLRIRAQDAVGHVTEKIHVVAYDTARPVPVTSEVLGGGSVADGDTVRIRTEWNLAGLRVSANFAPLDDSFSPGRETVTEGPPGTYLIAYRVSPSSTRAPDEKRIGIHASTGIIAGVDTVSVALVDAGPRGGELVSVSHNRFDPDAGERVFVAAKKASAAVHLQVYNLAGQQVRRVEGAGWVEWDGRGEGGVVCGSGVYFLRVDVDGEVEVRRVAVLRGGGR